MWEGRHEIPPVSLSVHLQRACRHVRCISPKGISDGHVGPAGINALAEMVDCCKFKQAQRIVDCHLMDSDDLLSGRGILSILSTLQK